MAVLRDCKRQENRIRADLKVAYFKIDNIQQENGKIKFNLKTYIDREARDYNPGQVHQHGPMDDRNQVWIQEKSYELVESQLPNPVQDNLKPQDVLKHCLYVYLKNLPEFVKAIDI